MPSQPDVYDLTLLLDPAAEDERKAKIVADVEHLIAAHGEVVSRHDWGLRATQYPVRKRGEAEFHLLQFSGPVGLLEALDHALKITDGVLRHRVIKLKPGTPPPPDVQPEAVGAAAAVTGEPAPERTERPERSERSEE